MHCIKVDQAKTETRRDDAFFKIKLTVRDVRSSINRLAVSKDRM